MSALVFLIPVLILVLFGVLLYRRLVRAPRYGAIWVRLGSAVLLTGLGLAVIVAFLYQNAALDGPVARIVGMVGMTWLGLGFYLLLGTLLGALVALGLRLARRPDLVRPWHRRSVPVIVAASLLITGYGVLEARQLRLVETTVALAGLPPELEGYRIVVIGDLHAGPIRGADLTAQAVRLTDDAEPDLIVLAGDLTDGTTAQFAEVLDPLAALSAPDGVYAVTGNHEYYAGDAVGWVTLWRELGVTALLNESTTITRDGVRLQVAGVSDAAGQVGPSEEPADTGLLPVLGAALADVDPAGTSILLAHQPAVGTDPLVGAAGVDLMLSGHTHGGQLWPFTYLVRLANPTVAGVDEVSGTTTFTTPGVGTWGPPMRVLVPPQVSVLVLTEG